MKIVVDALQQRSPSYLIAAAFTAMILMQSAATLLFWDQLEAVLWSPEGLTQQQGRYQYVCTTQSKEMVVDFRGSSQTLIVKVTGVPQTP